VLWVGGNFSGNAKDFFWEMLGIVNLSQADQKTFQTTNTQEMHPKQWGIASKTMCHCKNFGAASFRRVMNQQDHQKNLQYSRASPVGIPL